MNFKDFVPGETVAGFDSTFSVDSYIIVYELRVVNVSSVHSNFRECTTGILYT